MPDESFVQRSKTLWSTGDYAPTGTQLEPVSHALVEVLAVGAGHRVLDVATGTGNCALAAVRRGAAVDASDFSAVMLEAARRRAEAAGVTIEWREAEATALPYDDDAFDAVTSVFGAVFAPDQEGAAAEALRVVHPGGKVGFTAWTSNGFIHAVLEATGSFAPTPSTDAPDTGRWGTPEGVSAIFAPTGCTPDVRRREVTFRYGSWDHCRSSLESHGMSVMAKQSMAPEQYDEMFAAIRDVVTEHDVADDGDGLALPSEYLEIVVTKP